MVCKEEIYTWFKDLNGSVRIDTMCGLLNLCLPLELRFLGTCVEDLASKDYAYFREAELRANSFSELSKCTNVRDAVTRSKLVTSLALLHLYNRSCSHAIFEALSEEMKCSKQETYDAKTLEEMLLLFTMATHHPSFSFDERSEFVKYREKLESVCASQSMAVPAPVEGYVVPFMSCPVPFMPPYPVAADAVASPGPYVPGCTRSQSAHKARLSSIEVKPEPQCKRSVKLSLQWSDRHQTEVVRSFQEISGLSQKLSRLSASDPSSTGKAIPQLPACIEKNEELDGMLELAEYFNWVASLPSSYLENELVGPFFEPAPCGKAAGFVGSSPPGGPPEAGLAPEGVGLLAFYGPSAAEAPAVSPMIPPMVATSVRCAGPGGEHVVGPSPCASPLSSAPASPYESPPTSGSNSRATSPWTGTAPSRMQWEGAPSSVEELLHRAHLKKYVHLFKGCSLDEVLAMTEDTMKHKGLPASCSRRLLKEVALLKSQSNGLLGSRAMAAGPAAAFSHASGDSSTTSCSSECSSPSPPPALKAVRTHSPASSGSEDSTQPPHGGSYSVVTPKWPTATCDAADNAPSVVGPETARLGSQPPSAMPFRYGPPSSLLLDPPHRFLVLADRPTYGPSRTVPPRGLAPVVKTVAPDGTPHSNPAVTTTAAFPMYSVGIMPAFPQHSFPPFLHTGHQSNGYLSFLGSAGYVAPPTTAAAYGHLFGAPSMVVPPPAASSKVVSCYNCGLVGHRGHECKEATLEEATKSAQFRLHFAPTAPEAQP